MQNINTMQVSEYSANLLRGTCTHTVTLLKGDKYFTGIYNGLSYWGRVEDHDGNFVEDIFYKQDDADNFTFDESYFSKYGGYAIVNS